MPLLDLQEFLGALERHDGSTKPISLLLFQAVMFAGTAFIDMEHLRHAGYATRKEARKAFFLKARVWGSTEAFDHLISNTNLVALRFRLRARPHLAGSGAPADDLLVRDAR